MKRRLRLVALAVGVAAVVVVGVGAVRSMAVAEREPAPSGVTDWETVKGMTVEQALSRLPAQFQQIKQSPYFDLYKNTAMADLPAAVQSMLKDSLSEAA